MSCPRCGSDKTIKNGAAKLKDQSRRQRYICRECNKRFNERTNTPMARLRTPVETVSAAINVRGECRGVRATGRSFAKSHATIIRWEKRMQGQESQWSPAAPEKSDVTVEGDELYTRVGENHSTPLTASLPPQ